MKLTVWKRFQYTGDVWAATKDQNSSSGNTVYTPLEFPADSPFTFEFQGSPTSVRSIIVSRTPIPRDYIIVGIRDRNGEAILGNSQYKVTVIEPIVNMFGLSEGFKMTLALGRDSTYVALVNNDPTTTSIGGTS